MHRRAVSSGVGFLSGPIGRTIEHRRDKVPCHRVRRLPRAAQLNRLAEAQMWFKKAMAIDEQTAKRAPVANATATKRKVLKT
jgi:hypothetical protein